VRRQWLKVLGLERFSGLYLWAMFIVVFGVWTPSLFLTTGTLHTVASSQAAGAVLALAALLPLAAGSFDLSIGATANLSGIIATTLQTGHHWSVGPAIGAALAVSAAVGAVNGFIIVRLHVSSFIATLGMGTVVGAVLVMVSGDEQPGNPTSAAWTHLTDRLVLGFPIIVVYMLVIAAVLWWALQHTPAGRYIYAVGGNAEAARLSGVATDRWTWLCFIGSGLVAGAGGVLYTSFSGPSLTFGTGLLLPAFAAAFLGSTQIHPGKYNVWGTVLAVYVLATGVQGLQYITGVQWLNDMFDGVALIGAVAFAVWRQRSGGAHAQAAAPGEDAGADGAETDLGSSPAAAGAET
jgi:ribose transport system permease protein